MKLKLFKIASLFLFLTKNAFCMHCPTTEDEVRRIFPKAERTHELTLTLIQRVYTKSPVSLNQVTRDLPQGYTLRQYAGMTFNNLSELHCKALEHGTDKNALDLGAGVGYFTAKMALNATHVHAIELSPTAADTIMSTASLYQKFSRTPLSVSVQNADITDPNNFSHAGSYDVITIFNVLHYQTPQQVSLTLQNCQSLLKDRDSRIYIIMNAISEWENINKFIQIAANVGREWPGHISYESVESFDDTGNNRWQIQKPKSLPFEHAADPLMIRKAFSSDKNGKVATVNNSYFFGDIASLRKIIELTNLVIEDIYYQTPFDGKCSELTPEIIKRSAYGIDLCAIAKLGESTEPVESKQPSETALPQANHLS